MSDHPPFEASSTQGVRPGGRVPPHSLDAERAVLGGILLENNALAQASEILEADDFYGRAYSLIESPPGVSTDHEVFASASPPVACTRLSVICAAR